MEAAGNAVCRDWPIPVSALVGHFKKSPAEDLQSHQKRTIKNYPETKDI